MKVNKIKVNGVFILALMILFVLTPLWLYLGWVLKDSRELSLITLDKTVPFEKRDEHISLFWVLNHYKYFKPDGNSYNQDNDYLGFFPSKEDTFKYNINDFADLESHSIKSISDTLDVYYIADTYGVYEHEWYELQGRPAFSKKIYGGAIMNDFTLAKYMLEQEKLVIGESNFLASPTSYKVRVKFQELFNVKWTGWVGRYFASLDTLNNNEIPLWVTALYHEQYAKEWPFESGGIILVNNAGKIVILDESKDLIGDIPVITSNERTVDNYGVNKRVRYPFWFEITFPDPTDSVEVISWFEIESTKRGDSLLKLHSIQNKFPAIMKGKHKNFYYLTGDFADNKVKLTNSHFLGVNYFKHFFFLLDDESQREEFFWKLYVPFMKHVLEDAVKEPI